MLLYDIFYYGVGLDADTRLPEKPANGMEYAVNTNGDGHVWVAVGGEWVESDATDSEQGEETGTGSLLHHTMAAKLRGHLIRGG